MKKGDTVIIDGSLYTIDFSERIDNTKVAVVLSYKPSGESNLDKKMDEVIEKTKSLSPSVILERKEMAKEIAFFWINGKLSHSSGTHNDLLRLYNQPKYLIAQINSLLLNGESVITILEVLKHSIVDTFWCEALNTNVNSLAKKRDEKDALYYSIKSSMFRKNEQELKMNMEQSNRDNQVTTLF